MLSIITINLNNAIGLEKTILSVLNQSCKKFEHIIIDGNSSDESLKIIEKYQKKLSYTISETDTGVYNAMNKGIRVSNGEYLLFLNSGDVFTNNDIVLNILNELGNSEYDIYYGDVNLMNENKITEHRKFPDKLTFNFFLDKTITHQVALIKKKLFDEIFYYNESFKMVSDWEFFICAICKFNKTYKHISLTIVNYDLNGMSSSIENMELINNERLNSLKSNFPIFLDDYKFMNYAKQILETIEIKKLLKLQNYKWPNKMIHLCFDLLLGFIKVRNNIFK